MGSEFSHSALTRRLKICALRSYGSSAALLPKQGDSRTFHPPDRTSASGSVSLRQFPYNGESNGSLDRRGVGGFSVSPNRKNHLPVSRIARQSGCSARRKLPVQCKDLPEDKMSRLARRRKGRTPVCLCHPDRAHPDRTAAMKSEWSQRIP